MRRRDGHGHRLGDHSNYSSGTYQERCVPEKTIPLPPPHPIPTHRHSISPLQEPCLTKDRVLLMTKGRGTTVLAQLPHGGFKMAG